jgi:RNA polymerase sigma factor (sigma-70 family)
MAQAFLDTIDKHKGLLYKVAGLYTDNRHDREDLYQEILYRLWKSFDSFEGRSGIGTWMYRVAMNTAIHFLKQQKRRPRVTGLPAENLACDDDASVEERFAVMHQHIGRLGLLDKGIVMLYFEGKSYEEIATIMGLSPSNVGTRLSRIRDKLKKQVWT